MAAFEKLTGKSVGEMIRCRIRRRGERHRLAVARRVAVPLGIGLQVGVSGKEFLHMQQ
jgi:hypothetical protein